MMISEIIEQDSEVTNVPGPDGVDVPVEVFNVTYEERDTRPKLRIQSVPGEEVLVHSAFTGHNIDDAEFVAHRTRKPRSELLRMGYDGDALDAAGTGDIEGEWNDERTHRLFYEDEDPEGITGEIDESMRHFWLHEVFLWCDYEETGEAQYRRVVMVGNTIFENEVTDYQPIVCMSTALVPHKHTGLSLSRDGRRFATVVDHFDQKAFG